MVGKAETHQCSCCGLHMGDSATLVVDIGNGHLTVQSEVDGVSLDVVHKGL